MGAYRVSRIAYRAAAIFAALVMAGCSGPSPQVLWQLHTQCPVTGYSSLDWSPDGTRIAYAADPVSYTYSLANINLFLLEVKSPRTIQQLTYGGYANLPIWSPDNTTIAYIDISGPATQIALMNTDGTHQRIIGTSEYGQLTWTPDSTGLVSEETRDGQFVTLVLSLDGKVPRVIDGIKGYYPDMSPDGNHLAFMTIDTLQIHVASLSGGGSEALTSTGYNSQPAWSPDGTSIAFLSTDYVSEDHIQVVDLATKAVRDLTQGFSPSWSPDSKQLAFISGRTGQSEIYTINVDGTGLTQLTHNPTGGICPH